MAEQPRALSAEHLSLNVTKGDSSMPLLRIDVIEGRSAAELKELLDAIHCAMLAAFKVPERDRYQIVHEHPAAELRIEDTGLGIPRTERIVLVQVTTRPRSRLEKQNLYELLCQELLRRCGVKTSDVVVSITQNTDEDWSFGYGRAQFVTGEL
jgi:phenylpyruvate tautomerase PptA (4-oxalocrotonate tautomerase family)